MHPTHENPEASVWRLLLKLFFVGVCMVFVGFVILIISELSQGKSSVSGGLVIFVGPIPIILGAGPNAVFAILLAVVLTIIGLFMFLLLRKQAFKQFD